MTNQDIGRDGETIAKDYLINQGFTILQKNYRTRIGEIDIIAKKEKTIYFIEVKTRYDDKKGKPYEAVDKRKIVHLQRVANYFLLKNRFPDYKLRIGVISILLKDSIIKFYDDLC
jgi:putative endonuclease